MVLIDEECTKIQATCERKWFAKLKHMIVEGAHVYVTNPMLVENKSTYKLGKNPNKLIFNYDTKLSLCDDKAPSTHGFCFADYALIQSNSLQLNLAYGKYTNSIILMSTKLPLFFNPVIFIYLIKKVFF